MKNMSKVLVGVLTAAAVMTLASCAPPGADRSTNGNAIGKTFKIGYDIEMTGALRVW